MFGTIFLILVAMTIGFGLCFLEESGKRTPVTKLIDKLEERASRR